MSLEEWLNEGRLESYDTSREEIQHLFTVYDRDISDARIENMSTDRRFATGYSAALMMARACLAASGYRTSGEGAHYLTIQSLAFTLNLDTRMVMKLSKFRQKRNIIDYEMAGIVSRQEVNEMIDFAQELNQRTIEWLLINHPEFVGR